MNTTELLTEAFACVRERVQRVTVGLGQDALAYRPDPDANSIAWLIWHATRIQDDHLADLAGNDQLWSAGGWARRFQLPFEDAETGYGHSSEQVASLGSTPAQLLIGYHEAVIQKTIDDLGGIVANDLDRIIDERWDPPVTAGVRLVSVIDDSLQHVGQAAYVRGMYERHARQVSPT